LKNAGEVVLTVFFIGECDSDSMGVGLSGINFAKTIAKDSGAKGDCFLDLIGGKSIPEKSNYEKHRFYCDYLSGRRRAVVRRRHQRFER
jgi:hypothetical protein